jgi:hypothetical protein
VLARKTLSHTEVLDASPDAIWEACKHADELLPKAMPEFFASSTFLQGHGEPGSIRVVKMGPGMKNCRRNLVTSSLLAHQLFKKHRVLI